MGRLGLMDDKTGPLKRYRKMIQDYKDEVPPENRGSQTFQIHLFSVLTVCFWIIGPYIALSLFFVFKVYANHSDIFLFWVLLILTFASFPFILLIRLIGIKKTSLRKFFNIFFYSYIASTGLCFMGAGAGYMIWNSKFSEGKTVIEKSAEKIREYHKKHSVYPEDVPGGYPAIPIGVFWYELRAKKPILIYKYQRKSPLYFYDIVSNAWVGEE